MWKREEPHQRVTPQATGTTGSARPTGSRANQNVLIGKSIVVEGELHGSEDLTIEGRVEGKITLKQHVLTIGAHAHIQAQVFAKSVVVLGEVIGNIEATETVSIGAEGSVEWRPQGSSRRHLGRSQVQRRHRYAAGAAGQPRQERTTGVRTPSADAGRKGQERRTRLTIRHRRRAPEFGRCP